MKEKEKIVTVKMPESMWEYFNKHKKHGEKMSDVIQKLIDFTQKQGWIWSA